MRVLRTLKFTIPTCLCVDLSTEFLYLEVNLLGLRWFLLLNYI